MELDTSELSTIRDQTLTYGINPPEIDDPAEIYHEASSFYPTGIALQVRGAVALEYSAPLRNSATRSTKRHPHVPFVSLPNASPPTASIAQVVEGRRSHRAFSSSSISLEEVASILHTGYGITHRAASRPGVEQTFRFAPSGGALYPLELYLVGFQIDGVRPGLFHYDPFRHVLESLREGDLRAEVIGALALPEPMETCAAAIVLTAMFWRTRFKYGLRGYRFALLEAGHVAQNVLLAAEGLGLGAIAVGGFYDRRVASVLAVDGINEAPLYVLPCGKKRRSK